MSDIFSILPIEVALDERLTKTQLRVLIALLSFRGKNTNTVWPSRDTLSKRCGLPVNKISYATTELCSLGWLKKLGNGGRSKANVYEVTVPDFDEETLPESVTVPELGRVSKTLPESGSKTLPESGTKTLPKSGRGIEVTNELTKEVTISLPPASADAATGKKSSEKDPPLQTLCREIWAAYKTAFFARYGTEPVRNATVNTQVRQFAQRIGKEGVHVAGWFLSHRDAWYLKGAHSFGLLLKDAEALRTQWATNKPMTGRQAREGERLGVGISAALNDMDLDRPWGKQA